ncbi:hypothetical protein GQF02_04940 [Neisseriaceae bacterium B2N2-7]|uniref:FimV N-terminal domain-containing protein n=1 Tax=Craterilacuibacter sinensis TaxID=2686017 RepID=A0A845BJG3_9NEIS|nr:hypothetical protein [Craterilacuibacter sinensis]
MTGRQIVTRRNTKKLSVVLVSLVFASSAWAGLGGIQVRSSLGESLRANIALSGADAQDADKLRVSLASPDAFRDLNIDYAPVLGSLRFAVVNQGGKPYIRVISSQAIHDPYLRFVIEARSPAGRSLREYTVLLDPADYPLRQPVLEQDLPLLAKTSPRAAHAKPVQAGMVEVAPGQTLMSLARNARPADASLNQAMAAIFKANPHAFIAGNPERMMAGARLAIPGAARIRAINPLEASRLLAGGAVASEVPASIPPAKVAAVTPAPAPIPTPAPKLKSVPDAATSAPAKPLTEVQAPVSNPTVKLSAPESGGPEADARLSVLEQELEARDRTLAQTQEKIVQLEARLKAMQAAPATTQLNNPDEDTTSLLDGVFAQLPLIGGGLAALALALLGVTWVRKRRESGRVDAALAGRPLGAASALQHGALMRTQQTEGAGGNSFLTDFTRSGMGSIDAGEVDPVAEAEVYLAYGRDQQAEDILLDALQKDPTRHEVRLKLLEIYASRADKDTFEHHARELKLAQDGRGVLWAKAAALGLALDPQNSLYADESSSVEALGGAPAMAAGPIDLDAELSGVADVQPLQKMAADVDFAMPAPAATPVVPLAAPSMADHDADDPLRAALFGDEPPAVEPEPVVTHDSNMLDFDMDAMLGGLGTPAPAVKAVSEAEAEQPADHADNGNLLDFDFQMGMPASEPTPAPAPLAAAAADDFDSLFEFDQAAPAADARGDTAFDALTADLEAEFAPVSTEGMSVSDDPLSTKLDLARVYLDMGDKEGAREVLLELLGETEGALRDEAGKLLATL